MKKHTLEISDGWPWGIGMSETSKTVEASRVDRRPESAQFRLSCPYRTKHRSLGTGLVILALLTTTATRAAVRPDTWVGAWGFAATSFIPTKAPSAGAGAATPADFDNVTVRQIVRIVQPANRIRIRLSNEFGDAPLHVAAVHIALAGQDGSTLQGSDHPLKFSGQSGAWVPAGAPLLSDAVDWKIPRLSKLAISIYLPERTTPPAHRLSEYISAPGDFTTAQTLPEATMVRSGALVSEVDIVSPSARRALVTLGDSITEGFGSTANAFRGWSDRLAERLADYRATRDWSVLNAGINSNRLLHNGPGTGALARFDRDVLSVPGLAAIILLEGINDIGYSDTVPSEAVDAQEIIAAYRQLVDRAHARGIAVIGATITPFEGAHYYVPAGEQVRQTVNAWIRAGGAFDGIIDFDAAMRDPAHPTQVKPDLQRGDHLHPNDAGYAAMADAIDLRIFSTALRKH
jgi:lysophospholipase L1-like esterase